jgi:hypothetical protein
VPVGRAVERGVVVDHRDAVGGGVRVQLQVAEALVDGAPERDQGVLAAGELVDVPAAVRVRARVRPVEVGMTIHNGRACHPFRLIRDGATVAGR